MEIQDIHVGNQLHASSAMGQLSPAITPAVRDPTCLGVGPLSIPGSIFANGLALVGSPLAYPSIPEANLMVARSNPLVNPKAAAVPSIFKVTSKFGIPATPLDVMLGDFGIGMVGITINSLSIAINNATICVLNSPTTILLTNEFLTGSYVSAGIRVKNGTEVRSGAEVTSGVEVGNSLRKQCSITDAPVVSGPLHKGKIFTGKALKDKGFDIEHPTRKGKRVRHICVEGPESAIYIRGKLHNKHIIDIPEYWQGLVDYDTITVNLTPCGKPDLSLYVKEIKDNKIILSSDHLTQVQCFYQVWANRIGPELHVEYDGESPADYPGDQSGHSIAGYTYDKEVSS